MEYPVPCRKSTCQVCCHCQDGKYSIRLLKLKFLLLSIGIIFTIIIIVIKGTGHFFETLSVGSVPGADHS